jgi:putative transposase
MAANIKTEVIDELLAGCSSPSDLFDNNGLFKQLKKQLLERLLSTELSDHLGYEKGDTSGRNSGNSRNGHFAKTVLSDDGPLPLSIPRDRNGTFEPKIVPKGVRRLEGFDDRIISLYARGMSVREIQGHLQEMYGIEVSPGGSDRQTTKQFLQHDMGRGKTSSRLQSLNRVMAFYGYEPRIPEIQH